MSNFVSTTPGFFCDFSFISNVFINIHEYSNEIICISDNPQNVLCLQNNLIIDLVFYDEMLLRYEYY